MGVYDAARIDGQLDQAARNFVNGETAVDPAANSVRLSAIFRWYAGDFCGRQGVLSFVVQHLAAGPERDWLAAQQAAVRITYTPYDWSLNGFTAGRLDTRDR